MTSTAASISAMLLTYFRNIANSRQYLFMEGGCEGASKEGGQVEAEGQGRADG